ncbi:Glucokinase regulator family [Mycena kentingensis (nom. inval.)]|nr:Glucokinase regulator family [Mycena kentingensis (nom. inval.)]
MSSTAWLHHELAQVVSAPPSLTVQPHSLLLAPPPNSASAATASTSKLSPSPPSPHSPLSAGSGSGSARHSNPDALLPELCTERQNSATRSIDTMSTLEMCQLINAEDAKVARAVADVVPIVSEVIDRIAERIADGGRLLMMGAGNSGRCVAYPGLVSFVASHSFNFVS